MFSDWPRSKELEAIISYKVITSVIGVAALSGLLGFSQNISARAEGTRYAAASFQISESEKAACTDDAARFCSDTYPDEHRLLACMKTNRAALGSQCRPVFEAGLKRRHLQ